jgi:hypothetical protein
LNLYFFLDDNTDFPLVAEVFWGVLDGILLVFLMVLLIFLAAFAFTV